ncbi:MAG: alpha-xylosidase, partial [Muribaculaceae bacterium]|nr:alpha-xylosidase [Muribaculaceae bacterium]
MAFVLSLTLFAEDVKLTNPLVFGNNRMTLITPTLIRLEYALDGKFIDEPTMLAYDRSSRLGEGEYTVTKLSKNKYEIKTDKMTIVYKADGYPFSTSNLAVHYEVNGKSRKFTNRFITKNNLGGPVETLDRVTQEIPMQEGLLSTDGWYIIDDSRADLLVDGWLHPRDTKNHIQDEYCFIYGNDYKAALRSLGELSGYVPMNRKSMHGVWYCRYWPYTADEFLGIIDGYDENDFPIDNIVFDMDWHTSGAKTGTGHNGNQHWTGYTWDKELIPDPKALIDEVHRRGLTVTLNDHPHDGLRPHEEHYADFAKELGLKKKDKVPQFDLSDRRYMETFFKHAHKPNEDMGVDLWWLDWQQNYLYPYVFGTNTRSLSWINELYYNRSVTPERRGQNYSRWAGWGDHRHPIQFSGDAQANWEMLAFEVKLSAASGNAGCYFWAHDIGGFRGEEDNERLARWTQFGAMSAALRVHSARDPKLDRRPWLPGGEYTEAMRRAYKMRAELLPYVYTSVWQVHKTMVPLTRPMYIDYGKQKFSFDNPQQYMLGDLMLVAPITQPGKGPDFYATQKVWFPDGEIWYDFFTHEPKRGNTIEYVGKPLNEFPVYVKGGWVLPMQPYT